MNSVYLIVLQEPSEYAWDRLAQTWTSKYLIDDRTALVSTPPSSTSQEVSAVSGMDSQQRIRRLETQLATLEERSRHMATRAWVLAGVLGGMATAAGLATVIALTVVRVFWNPN